MYSFGSFSTFCEDFLPNVNMILQQYFATLGIWVMAWSEEVVIYSFSLCGFVQPVSDLDLQMYSYELLRKINLPVFVTLLWYLVSSIKSIRTTWLGNTFLIVFTVFTSAFINMLTWFCNSTHIQLSTWYTAADIRAPYMLRRPSGLLTKFGLFRPNLSCMGCWGRLFRRAEGGLNVSDCARF